MRNLCVIVLGMHRSGTSALSGALDSAGVSFGSNLLAPSSDNPTGFVENSEIVHTHDLLLATLNSSWDDVIPLPDRWWVGEEVKKFSTRLKEIAEQQLQNHSIWGLKDPRLCRLLPVWHDILDEIGCDIHHVINHRHPIEVGASLKKRNNFGMSKTAALWVQHYLMAEYYSRGCSRIFTSYDQFFDDPARELTRILQHIKNVRPHSVFDVDKGVNFLSTDLRHHHHNSKSENFSELENGDFVLPVFRALCDSATDQASEISEIFDQVRTQFIYQWDKNIDAAAKDHIRDLYLQNYKLLNENEDLSTALQEIRNSLPYRISLPFRKIYRSIFLSEK